MIFFIFSLRPRPFLFSLRPRPFMFFAALAFLFILQPQVSVSVSVSASAHAVCALLRLHGEGQVCGAFGIHPFVFIPSVGALLG